MSGLVLVGISHRTTGIELRERLALSPAHATSVLGDLVAQRTIREAPALSTCGRTELYALASDAGAAEAALLGALAARAGVEPEALVAKAKIARGFDALEHLFRVAAPSRPVGAAGRGHGPARGACSPAARPGDAARRRSRGSSVGRLFALG